MAYSQSARAAARWSRPTVYRARRRRLLLGVALILFLAHTGAPLLNDTGHAPMPRARTRLDHPRTSMAAVSWPQQGQAALVLGNGLAAASPGEQPVPIASLAKVMTALLVLKRYPLSGAQDGFMLTMSASEAEGVAQDRAEGQSVVALAAGEQLTERQLLEGLLIPSGNNIARILGEVVAGSQSGFVEDMNREARALGMDHTTYTDPSGWDPGTVSTAADQLRVFEQALRLPVFRQIVSMPSVTLPIAGTLTNFNPLVAEGYPGKTGSDTAAGGCLAFFTQLTIGGTGRPRSEWCWGRGRAATPRGSSPPRARPPPSWSIPSPRRSACARSPRPAWWVAQGETSAAIAARCYTRPASPRHSLD